MITNIFYFEKNAFLKDIPKIIWIQKYFMFQVEAMPIIINMVYCDSVSIIVVNPLMICMLDLKLDDLNSYLPPFSKQYNIFPSIENHLTTIKKRTMTQGQFHKAQKVVQQSKDKIITTLEIEKSHIMYINSRIPSKDNYVPTNEHSFDHFVVVAQLKINVFQ